MVAGTERDWRRYYFKKQDCLCKKKNPQDIWSLFCSSCKTQMNILNNCILSLWSEKVYLYVSVPLRHIFFFDDIKIIFIFVLFLWLLLLFLFFLFLFWISPWSLLFRSLNWLAFNKSKCFSFRLRQLKRIFIRRFLSRKGIFLLWKCILLLS